MTVKNTKLEALLNADGLGEAEKLTGKSYKSDSDTLALGILAVQRNAGAAKKALAELGDTYHSMPFTEGLEIIEDLGFEKILVRAFLAYGKTEYQVLYWRKDGVLLKVDSYGGGEKGTVNGLSIYYNIEFKDSAEAWKVGASGHYHRESYDAGRFVWVGNHSLVSGALRYTLACLEEKGTFLPVWIEDVHPYLNHYGKDEQPSTAELFSRFPAEVQDALAVMDLTDARYAE